MRFTITQREEGEMLVRRMSDKARKYYDNNEIKVYADNRYDNLNIWVRDVDGVYKTNFRAIQSEFEALQDASENLEGVEDDA